MSSNKLRTLNSYPEWKTKRGIDEVRAFVSSIQNREEPNYPANLTNEQKRRYMDKFGKDYYVERGKLYYIPIINGTEREYRIKNEIIYPEDKEKALKELYDDLSKGAAIGIKAFYSQVAHHYLGFTRVETTAFLKKQGAYNISRPYKKIVNRPVLAKAANERWAIDLMSMSRLHFKPTRNQTTRSEYLVDLDKHNENGKYTHILTCVDFFSKKVWARAIESAEAPVVKHAFNMIMVEATTVPRILQTDNGVEFVSNIFIGYLLRMKIKHILTKPYASTSQGLIERVNQMLRAKIRDGFIRHNNLEWKKYLPLYVENINNQKPARGKFTPNQLWTAGYQKPSNNLIHTKIEITDNSSKEDVRKYQQFRYLQRAENQIKDDLRRDVTDTRPNTNFKVGDYVRIRLTAFPVEIAKAMTNRHKNKIGDVKFSAITYTPFLFTINKVLENKPKRKRGETENDAEVRYKLANPAKVQYTLKDSDGNIVKDEGKKKPKYFYKSDLQLIPRDSVPTKIDTIQRVEELNRMKKYTYIPFVDDN